MAMYSAESPRDNSNDDTSTDSTLVDKDNEWLSMARDAYDTATDYFDSSIRRKQENAMAHFNNRHAPGSKYDSDLYKTRSRGFRPKSRAVVRKNEAAAAKAFFSTDAVVNLTAEDPSDAMQVLSAMIMNEIVNYRLKKDINWFNTVIGAYQDTLVAGVCISHQTWDYEEVGIRAESAPEYKLPDENEYTNDSEENDRYEEDAETTEFEATEDESVETTEFESTEDTEDNIVEYRQVRDKPVIELRPVENVLFSPASDWVDPIASSPFIIDKISMFIGDVKLRIQQGWNKVSDAQLSMGASEYNDSIRYQRERNREDSKDITYATQEFETVWVHRNIVRKDGRDYIYYTLGTIAMLSDPVPLVEEYKHLREGQRPYIMGSSVMETHRVYPSSLTMLTEGLQQEANDVANQRRDNVALVLNKRYYVKRGSGVDYKSLTKNIPGSVTLMSDIQNDVRTESPPDVTQSAYQEQDRINMDYDELAGSFSSGSVGSNRALNETVGGMNLMQGDANEMIEYQLRVFSETWVEKVIQQIIQLEQAYETDQAIMNLAGSNIDAMQRFGIDEITDQMLQGSMTIDVNVGFGATNPQKRVEKLTLGIRTIAEFNPQVIQQMDMREIATEVLGSLGYKGVERFFPGLKAQDEEVDPQIAQLQQELQAAQQELQTQQQAQQAKFEHEKAIADGKNQTTLQAAQINSQTQMQIAQGRADVDMTREEMKAELSKMDVQIKHAKSEIERGKLINARDALLWQMEMESKQDMLPNPDNRQGTTIMNDRYGKIPGQEG